MFKSKKKNAAAPVYKPYLKGRPVSAAAARRAWRVLGLLVLFALVSVLLGGALSFSSTIPRILINGALVAAACLLMSAEGKRQGESDVAFAEIAHNRLSGGKAVEDSEKNICYHPCKGFFTALVGTAPLLLLTLAFALIAHKQSYALGPLPAWVSAFEGQAEIGQALAYYHETSAATAEDILRIVVRLALFPYVNLLSSGSRDTLYLVDKLSPLLCLIVPAFYGVGYLRGPYLRALVHGNIRMSRRRHNRNERKAREARAREIKKKELI